MDLIYADAQRQDIGVMMAYKLDMAYGSGENNFECTVDRGAHCCGRGFLLYVEGEEYGGVIDRIRVNTAKDEIIYKGRTWHGVLEKKVICPEEGQDYLVLNGEANEVLQEIISLIGLSDLFEASSDDSGIQIVGYQMNRYIYGYTGIKKMLKELGPSSEHAGQAAWWSCQPFRSRITQKMRNSTHRRWISLWRRTISQ